MQNSSTGRRLKSLFNSRSRLVGAISFTALANHLAAGSCGGDDCRERTRSRVTKDRRVADHERLRCLQATRSPQTNQSFHRFGHLVAISELHEALRFEAANYLDSEERQVVYITAAVGTGDADFVRDARAARSAVGRSGQEPGPFRRGRQSNLKSYAMDLIFGEFSSWSSILDLAGFSPGVPLG